MSPTATYLYALARAATVGDPSQVRGVADAPVRTLVNGELGCYVSTVPLAEFGAEALRANLEDLAWLERTARQHDQVVQACAQVTTIAPVRLATVFADDRSVVERLAELRASALDVLAQVDAREEWGVKVYAAGPARPPAGNEDGDSSGIAYLRRRQQEQAARTEAADHAARDAETVFAALAELAVLTRRHRPQDPRLSGDPRPMVLNAAFLVDRDGVDAFRAAVAEVAAHRPPDSVVLTGPWPPYSFTTLDEP